MDVQQLLDFVKTEESKGHLQPGEAVIVGVHEPAPVDGALRVGRMSDGFALVERLEGDSWAVTRAYERPGDAYRHTFDVLSELTAARYWGEVFWSRRAHRVGDGCVLRTASLLLDPRGNLLFDRGEMVERLRALGLSPEHRYWVEGIKGFGPPEDEIHELHRAENDGWKVIIRERGVSRELARFAAERDACQWLFAELVSQAAVNMGHTGPHGDVDPTSSRCTASAWPRRWMQRLHWCERVPARPSRRRRLTPRGRRWGSQRDDRPDGGVGSRCAATRRI